MLRVMEKFRTFIFKIYQKFPSPIKSLWDFMVKKMNKIRKAIKASKLQFASIVVCGGYFFLLSWVLNFAAKKIYGFETNLGYSETQELYELQKSAEITNLQIIGGYGGKWLEKPIFIISFMVLLLTIIS